MPRIYKSLDPEVRFWRKVRVEMGGCWIWTGGKGRDGVGLFYKGGGRKQPKQCAARRFSYEVSLKKIPDGMDLTALCGEDACVHPLHLQPVRRGLIDKIVSPSMGEDEFQILLGSLLGDGRLAVDSGGRLPHFTESHSIAQSDYASWKASQLISLNPSIARYETTSLGKSVTHIVIRSRVSKGLQELYSDFYQDTRLRLCRSTLWRMSPLGLAVWWQDDGHYHQNRRYGRLATHAFGYSDNHWLASEFFPQQFGLRPVVRRAVVGDKSWPLLQFSVAETTKLASMIRPYIHKTMQYKVGSQA